MGSYKKQKLASADDGWGASGGGGWGESGGGGWGESSKSSNKPNDDGWGASGGGGWGAPQDDKRKPKGDSGFGASGGGGWGESSSKSGNKPDDDGWGASGGGGWGESSSKSGNKPNDDGWGASGGGGRGAPQDDKRKPKGDSGFGASSGGGWGESSSKSGNKPNDDGWGASGGGGWGASEDNRRKPNGDGGFGASGGGGWGESSSKSGNKPNDDGWGASGGGGWGASEDNRRKPNGDGGFEASGGGGWGATEDNNGKPKGDGGWGDSSSRPRDKPDEDRPAPYRPEEIDLDEEAKLNKVEEGVHFDHYCDQVVTCVPPGIVKPINEFKDVISSDLLLSHLEKANYKRMTPIQKWAMPALLDGLNIIGCAQTGSGKTAAFTVPVIQTLLNDSKNSNLPNNADQDIQEPSCLIIAPTRELARQLHSEALKWSRDTVVKCHVIYGGISTGHLKAQISRGCNLLVSTPGRLKDFVARNWIGFKNIKFIILDEGDRLIDDGFIKDIREILAHESMPPQDQRQILFFSATFKPDTQKVARELIGNKFVFITVGRVGSANSNITQEFIKVTRAEKKRELKKILAKVPEDQKTIIFTQTKAAADMLAGFFTALNLSATSIHGDRHQQQREEAILQFKKGERRFLISSPVGNRGLDLPKVYLVINYDLPNNIDEYVHRIGRTGRAGHPGKAISFYDQDKDTEILEELIALLKEANQEIPDFFTSSSNDMQSANGEADGGWGNETSAAASTDAGTAVDEEW